MTTITLIGCGNMGNALLQGWLNSRIKANYIVIDPHKPALAKNKSVTYIKTPTAKIKKSDVIVLAVKPQMMNETLKQLKPFVSPNTFILSIAAGRSIKSFEKAFGKSQPIIRTMPNLPAAIGKGMTVAIANKNAKLKHKKLAQVLMQCVGKVEWLKNEKQMDAATAIVGNGPAYVFYLIELMTKAAQKAGLDERLARSISRQTVIGGGALAESRADTNAAALRKNVTSPGGTTEAALKILMNGETQKLFDKAIAAGKKRSQQLSS